jgi:CxxC-x17-CxxC domain-containing protein
MKNFKEGGFGRQGGGGFGGRQRFGGGGDRVGNGRGKFGGDKRGGKFGGGNDRGGRPFDKPELFAATCSSCGKPCEVPFRPSPDKPVYCSACFGKNAGNDIRGKERAEKHSGGDFKKEFKPRHEERSFKQDYIPVEKDTRSHDELKKQISALESKLNRVIELLSTQPKAAVATTTAEALADEAPKKVRKPKTVLSKAVVKKKAVKKAAKAAKAVKKAVKAKK